MRIAPLVVLLFLLCGTVFSAESQPPSPTPPKTIAQPKATTGQNKSNPKNHEQVAQSYPPSIEIYKVPIIQLETTDKTQKRHDYSSSEWWLVYLTGIMAAITAALAFYTGRLYRATVKLGAEAKITSERQAAEMATSIAEATRSATAMELVASHMEISAKSSTESVAALKERTAQQMRAYLSVSIGGGIFQERHKNLKFEVKPTLFNSGNTPAHKITYWAKAEILSFPLPDNFNFPPIEDTIQSSLVLGPHQSIILNAMVNNFLPDEEVESVKRGIERRTHIWGIVTYTDVFGDIHSTKFSHSICWLDQEGNEIITGNYSSRHNEAD